MKVNKVVALQTCCFIHVAKMLHEKEPCQPHISSADLSICLSFEMSNERDKIQVLALLCTDIFQKQSSVINSNWPWNE